MNQTIQPASNTLFCKPEEAETTTASGLYVPAGTAEKPLIAVVINRGAGVTEFEQEDRIVYKSYTTSDIKLDGKEYFLINVEDVLGKVVET